ncbi:MAG TPA: hypothetical protein VHS79_13330 [Actinomycetes bacterium]|nr:hypothetical protein [Actinomycetota bacterium]HEV3495624.1 hypothetical protein [Actinomycetes bacterium]HEV3504451.1 hypothetical protein [Actinomycetes bacterium]HEX2157935.1 hypothetical protein [Actinomycetes bacterium]
MAVNVLDHLADPAAALREAKRGALVYGRKATAQNRFEQRSG